MQNSIFLIPILFSVALSLSCDGITEVCAAVSCPSAPTFQVNSFSYSPSDFNLISFGSITMNHGDVEGRVAVRNDFNAPSEGVSIGYSLPSSSSPSYSLVAGGNVNWVNGEIYPSGAGLYVGGTFTGAATLRAKVAPGGGCGQTAGCLNGQFDALSQYATSLSNTLAGLTVTATATVQYQQLILNCSGSANLYVVAVGASVFSGVNDFSTTGCDANAVFLFNIMGADKVTFKGRTFASHLAVYNLPMSTSVEIDTFVYGDIIAPAATLGMSVAAGTVTGLVIANDVSELIQVNIPMCPNQTTTSTGSQNTTSTGASSTGSDNTTATGAATSTESAGSTSTSGVPSDSSTSTSGVPSSSSTGSSTTGGNGNPICTFLDDQAACPNINNALNGNYTFVFGHYDVIVFGDLAASSGDVEGRTFASGNVDLSNGMFSFGLRAATSNSDYSLIAGGLNFASGSISRGRAFVAGTSTVADYLNKYIDGPCSGSCLDSITSQGQSCYNSLSDTFAGRSNAALSLDGSRATLTCNSSSDSVYYINVDSSAINAASWGSSSNCNAGAIYVFNIGGSDDFSFSGAVFPTYNVVYNVRGSRTVTIGTSVHGNILAPQANVVMNSGLIVGKLVAAKATIVQVNIIPECVDNGNSGSNSDAVSGTSAGINLTPSILVMLIALFISKMF